MKLEHYALAFARAKVHTDVIKRRKYNIFDVFATGRLRHKSFGENSTGASKQSFFSIRGLCHVGKSKFCTGVQSAMAAGEELGAEHVGLTKDAKMVNN